MNSADPRMQRLLESLGLIDKVFKGETPQPHIPPDEERRKNRDQAVQEITALIEKYFDQGEVWLGVALGYVAAAIVVGKEGYVALAMGEYVKQDLQRLTS